MKEYDKERFRVNMNRGNAGRKPELLIPAGSLEVFRTAVLFGADAVYIGGEAFGLRAKAKNFSSEEMQEAVAFAHSRGVKVYVTANILAHNADLKEAEAYFRFLKELRPDALLIADPGMFDIARRICPEIDIHISTQANNVNAGTFLFWHRQGATRIVCGRELSLAEIADIKKAIPEDLEIEAFVHGAMCISYSGRCLLSNYLAGRDANHGECTHPCRWKYSIVEETRPGEFMPVFENERGTYIFNSRDLCMIDYIPELVEAGIDSLKVEGRMKNALYVATVARTYRLAIDDWFEDPAKYEARREWYRQQIASCTYRQFTTGFFFGKPGSDAQIYDNNTYIRNYIYLGIASEPAPESAPDDGQYWIGLEQRNKFCTGDMIEIMKPNGDNVPAAVLRILGPEGEEMESAPHPRQKLCILASAPADRGDILRMHDPGSAFGII